MTRARFEPIVAGIDVGGPMKGFHAVALRGGGFYDQRWSREAAALVEWCHGLGVVAVGVDTPCRWSRAGARRSCEQDLSRAGLSVFATPTLARARRHPFYAWMLNGAELVHGLRAHYRLFDGRTTGAVLFETFPHAAACALAGRMLSAKKKRLDRRSILARAGIATTRLRTIDAVDAALCALTAQGLMTGCYRAYGGPADGYIIVPAPA